MESSEIRSLILFFFFALLDEKATVTAASEAYGNFVNHMKKHPQSNRKDVWLSSAYSTLQKIRKKNKGPVKARGDLGFALTGAINLGPWREYHASANPEEMVVVIFRQILGASEAEISRCLRISTGSVRYRLGKALPALGEFV